ncbi:MAG: tubulin-like doman-containing protein [Coriobacteriales bacterium]|jgi:hypothetical protein|nr:tubulin-like doman-containing protein [Coriobacteriales bacterium]
MKVKIAPTLIIGLGGTGATIINRVNRIIRESGNIDSGRVRYCAFDTDVNELRDIKNSNPDIRTVQTSTKATVGEYLENDRHARDTWFPNNAILARKTLTEGAGQVRAISRLAFNTTLKSGALTGLHEALDSLLEVEKDAEEQSLRVIIVSSLCGGTGSGLILPVAMYLKKYIAQKYSNCAHIVRGFFIQPDVFFKVIHGEEERNNLRCNAYATIRELNAFMMKGDSTLPKRFNQLKFEFPRVSSEGVDEVNYAPYDFCFLFDSNNTAGNGLNNYQDYLNHAATCVYALSLGPTSKRANSSEDNTIRVLSETQGRGRYCGAGASRVIYPWKNIRDFITYNWVTECVSGQWLKYDKQINEIIDARKEQSRKLGSSVSTDVGQEYISAIVNRAETKDGFSIAILNSTRKHDPETLDVTDKSIIYMTMLEEYIKGQSTDQRLRDQAQVCTELLEPLAKTKDGSPFLPAYKELRAYSTMIDTRCEATAAATAYALFNTSEINFGGLQEHQLEKHLTLEGGGFIHPNAMRYFFYQIKETIHEQLRVTDHELEKLKATLKEIEDKPFDKSSTEEVEGQDVIADAKIVKGPLALFHRGGAAYIKEVRERFDDWLQYLEEKRVLIVKQKVYSECYDYAFKMCRGFEKFYDNLESKLIEVDYDKDNCIEKYESLTGTTTRYVLSDRTCMEHFRKDYPYRGNPEDFDGEVSRGIYMKIREYANATTEQSDRFFYAIFDEQIIGDFRKSVERDKGGEIKVDIFKALEKEYKFQNPDWEQKDVIPHIESVINDAKRLAAPFIENPGEEAHPISACGYNSALLGKNDPARKQLVERLLKDFGGVEDESMSEQEILFFKAYYALTVDMLGKYAHGKQLVGSYKEPGAYFSAYFNLVDRISPSMGSLVITPHLDRRWHTLLQMPDVDEQNEKEIRTKIHQALFFGLVYGAIKNDKVGANGKYWYYYRPQLGVPVNLQVSTGSECDRLYEVLDAITIDSQVRRSIIKDVWSIVGTYREENNVSSFSSSSLLKRLAYFDIPEANRWLGSPEQGDNSTPVIEHFSFFDLPLFLAISTPNAQLQEDDTFIFTRNLLETVFDFILGCTDEDQARGEYVHFLVSQLEVFINNLPHYIERDIIARRYASDILNAVSQETRQGYLFNAILEPLEKISGLLKIETVAG